MCYITRAKGKWGKVYIVPRQCLVKNMKVNALFDSDSQCNIIYVALVDELGLETYEHPHLFIELVAKELIYENHKVCKVKFY
jgi:hypothetical protein